MPHTPAATPAPDSPADLADIALLAELTHAHGAPSCEGAVRQIVAKQIGGDLRTDKMGSVLRDLPGPAGSPRVMVTAHMDEVGFMVQSVTAEGFLRIVPLGGWWGHTLLAQRVRVLTRAGHEILGLITSTPPHLLSSSAKETVIGPDAMFIDVGARDAKDVKEGFGIMVGDTIVPDSDLVRLHNPRLLMAKAFDNRVGCAAAIQAFQRLEAIAAAGTTPLPCTVVGAWTVQEEVGTRGAQTAVAAAKPDVALVLEGPPADDLPGSSKRDWQGALYGGPQIRMFDPTAITNRSLVDAVIAVAEAHKIPCQLAVRKSGGTDAKVIHLHDQGIPTVVLGVPARYIHTHNSIIELGDYQQLVDLVVALVQALDRPAVDRLTQYL